MEICYRSRKLEKLCNIEKEMRAKLGPRLVGVLQQRLAELRAADNLEDMRSLPGAGCHELSQDRKGQIAVTLVHPRRLVFEPADEPLPSKQDGGLDWGRVTRIRIIEIVDYH